MEFFRNRFDGQGDDQDVCPPGFVDVLLYDDKDDHTNLTGRAKHYKESNTCEDICKEIAIQNDMTPTLLPCFGISVYDPALKTFTWLKPNQRLGEVRCKNEGCEFHFRMRYLPHKSKIKYLQSFDVASFQYLFAQVMRDFLKNCLECFSSSEKIKEVHVVSVLLMMGKMRQDTEKLNRNSDDVKKLFKNFDSYLPASIKVNKRFYTSVYLFIKSFLDGRRVLQGHMKNEVKKLVEKYKVGTCDYLYIWGFCLNYILGLNHAYYKETFTAFDVEIDEEEFETVDDELHVDESIEKLSVCVEMGQTGQRLIVSNEKDDLYKIDLIDLTELKIKQEKEWWSVQIHHQNGHPKVIYFDDKCTAESFLSCLECYCRCVYDFYSSLCKTVQPSSHEDLKKIRRSHGLVSDDYVKRILLKKNSKDLYILRMNGKSFDVYDVLYLSNQNGRLKKASLPKIIKQGNGHIVEGSSEAPVDIEILLNRLLQNSNVLQESDRSTKQIIRPTQDGCDLVRDILFEKLTFLPDLDEEERQRERKNQENQPKVYMESDVKKLSVIGTGYFTETSYGMLLEKDMIVMKQLRTNEIHDSDFRFVYQEFQAGFQKLMTLFEPKYFVPYYGVCLGKTPCMLIGGTNYGSLSHFLQYREPVPILSFHHLLEVAVQVASALDHMVTIDCYHGNLNCNDLNVMTFDERYLIVKIADPGLVGLYNKLPIDHEVNQARMPWLAPELHNDLSAINIQTEVYSYGTMLWQMFSGGRSPIQHDPKLVTLTPTEIREFFARGNDILTCPETLSSQAGDPREIAELKQQLHEVMISCWKIDPQERMEPKRILRGLNGSMQSYGEVYHKYNDVSYIDYGVGMATAVSTGSGLHDGRLSSGLDPVHVSVPDISVLRKDRHVDMAGPSLPQQPSNPNDRSRILPQSRSQQITSTLQAVTFPQVAMTTGNVKPGRFGKLPAVPLPPVHLIDDRRINVNFNEKLGQGHYGQVYIGELKSLNKLSDGSTPMPQVVVVKKLKKEMLDKCEAELKKEAVVMARLDHPNIVKFIGMSKCGRYLVMEYVENDSLITYVKAQKLCKKVPFIKLTVDITAGMEYLEAKKILHCDLAARNILLTSDIRAKISDFGLSKVLPDDTYYYRKHADQTIPIPWCSPEVIEDRGKFTSKSDVWSFGVLLWEMYSYGKPPLIATNVAEILKKLKSGTRLQKTAECPDNVYTIMKQCWDIERDLRPSFKELNQRFKAMQSEVDPVAMTTAVSDIRNVGKILGQVTGSPPSAVSQSIVNIRNQSKEVSKGSEMTLPSMSTMTTGLSARSVPSAQSCSSQSVIIESKDFEYNPDDVIGRGSFGKVMKGRYKGNYVAIKQCTNDKQYARFQREFELLLRLRNSSLHIVKFIGIHQTGDNGRQVNGPRYMYLMEYMDSGSLYEYLDNQKTQKNDVPLRRRLQFLIDIAEGMNCLFSKSIVHCDLTAKNVLLNEELVCKISDFGWAKQLDGTEDNFQYQRKDGLMQILWTAPECFNHQSYNKYSDIWSYGVVCIEVFKDGETPHLDVPYEALKNDNIDKIIKALNEGKKYSRPSTCPVDIYTHVLMKCWSIKPELRIVYNDILRLLNKFVDAV